MNTCTVYVRAKDCDFILGHVTANSVFEAARNGFAWFEDASHRKAHPQSDDTMLESDQSVNMTRCTMCASGRCGERRQNEFFFARSQPLHGFTVTSAEMIAESMNKKNATPKQAPCITNGPAGNV
jgi:hypothetical protein